MREAIRWALILSALVHVGLQGLEAASSRKWNGRHAGLIRAPGDPRHVGSPSLTGLYLAIVFPLAPWWLWPVFALGLYWACSWLSFGALAVAGMLWIGATGSPGLFWGLLAGGAAIPLLVAALVSPPDRWEWLAHTPRDRSLDSIYLRLRTWRVVSLSLLDSRVWPWGRGWRHCGRDLRRYQVATGVSVMDDHVFNEFLEVVYELGIVGVLACLLGFLLLGGVVGREPFGMSLMVLALTMMGSLTLRTWPFPFLGLLLILGVCAS